MPEIMLTTVPRPVFTEPDYGTPAPGQGDASIKARIAGYLASQDLPFRYTAGDIAKHLGIDPGTEYKRRHRELRDLGWVILTYREDPSLGPREYLLVKTGGMPQ